jgi:hypothetical protein
MKKGKAAAGTVHESPSRPSHPSHDSKTDQRGSLAAETSRRGGTQSTDWVELQTKVAREIFSEVSRSIPVQRAGGGAK